MFFFPYSKEVMIKNQESNKISRKFVPENIFTIYDNHKSFAFNACKHFINNFLNSY